MLRHQPARIGLTLDAHGWADVDELLRKANQHGIALTREILQQVAEQNDKQRFAFNSDGTRLRANQGHSIEIDLGLEPIAPPDRLYHGTATRFIETIQQQGLLRGRRDYVHLSPDAATARQVGARHGEPIVLGVNAGKMYAAGWTFYCAANGVWLTDQVPVEYLDFPSGA
ncbi:putative RNA 2'-phosphotransferase [Thermoflexales bacterium]|nr:putative RNA 2'-phosphotransferase [Thermoflexales bacterium]